MLRLVLLFLLATVQGQTTDIRKMSEHRCLGYAWVADGNRFRYSELKMLPGNKMFYNGQYLYAFSTGIREGQTIHIDAQLNFKYYGGNFEFNVLGGTPIIKDGSGANVLHLKFTKIKNLMPPQSGQPARQNSTASLAVIANTLKNNEWMREIKSGAPFYGDKFLPLTITAMPDKFEIRTFGEVLLHYPYRLPLDYVQFVNALGEGLELSQIYIGGQIMMAPLRAVFPNGGIKPGFTLIIDAVAKNSDFSIAFTDPENKFGIMLEIKVNFSKQTVILNSKIGKRWGQAVRGSYFPFKSGKAFNMEVRFFERILTVYVDSEKELATFDYRALPTFGEMSFYGSLEIRGISVCEPQRWPMHTGDKYSGLLTKQTYSYQRGENTD
uniref:Galectin n=1 Tax=Panagrellus redivivus TaxID=6233 RepID=A0A7E4VWC4_PANRE